MALYGVIWRYFEELAISPHGRALLFTGGLGAFTTFSTFALDNVLLWRTGDTRLALLNILAQTIGGIFCVLLGFTLAEQLLRR